MFRCREAMRAYKMANAAILVLVGIGMLGKVGAGPPLCKHKEKHAYKSAEGFLVQANSILAGPIFVNGIDANKSWRIMAQTSHGFSPHA